MCNSFKSYKINYFESVQSIKTTDEWEALTYLGALNIPTGSYILTLTEKDELMAVTGAQIIDKRDTVLLH